jgi:hypothetical protein
MAEPSDRMMALMARGRGDEPPMGSAPDEVVPPMGAPMMTPEPKMGNKEAALINVGLALDLLEQSLPALGSESTEGLKVMAALRTLTGMMQPRQAKTNELKNAEILQLLQSLPQAGGGTPEGRAMAGAPPIPGMAGGAMPPPMPAGAPPMPPGAGAPPPGGMPMPPPGGAMPM